VKSPHAKPAGEQLWGPKELAHHLGVSEKTARKRMSDGTFPGFRVGKLWRIRPEDALSFYGSDTARPN